MKSLTDSAVPLDVVDSAARGWHGPVTFVPGGVRNAASELVGRSTRRSTLSVTVTLLLRLEDSSWTPSSPSKSSLTAERRRHGLARRRSPPPVITVHTTKYNTRVEAYRLTTLNDIYLFNVHRYNTRENNITKGNSMPLTGDKSTMVASMQVTFNNNGFNGEIRHVKIQILYRCIHA